MSKTYSDDYDQVSSVLKIKTLFDYKCVLTLKYEQV